MVAVVGTPRSNIENAAGNANAGASQSVGPPRRARPPNARE